MERLATLLDNAVLIRELRRRMRGRAMMFGLIGYIALISLVAYIILHVMTQNLSPTNPQQMLNTLSHIGQATFLAVCVIQAFLVLIVAPTITSAMTTMEKEKKTFEFLQVTPIKPGSYVFGGLMATLLYVLLALVCALPVISISFLYGGIGLGYVLASLGGLLGTALVLSSIGLAISSAKEKTRAAQGMMASIVIFVFVFGISGLPRVVYYFVGMRGAVPSFVAKYVQFFGVSVPSWIYWACVAGVVSAFFLIMAARKLYNTDARAFSYQQFLALFLLAMILLVGVLWGELSEETFLVFLIISVVLLFGAVLTFSVGRMEIGDDVWRLKRRYLWMRRVDENVWYLLGLLGIWVVMSALWAASAYARPPRFEPIPCIVLFCTPLFFLIMCGRLVTDLLAIRRHAVHALFGIAALLFFFLPLVAVMVEEATQRQTVMLEVIRQLSPFFVLRECMEDQMIWGKEALLLPLGPGLFTIIMYVIAGLCMAILTGIAMKPKKALRNYHYEFPV
jgi:hypothetical protein